MKAYNKLPIQSKLLLLGVLPAAAIALILALYFTSTRLNDMYDLLHKTNQNLAGSIAEASVNSVYTGNTASLASLLNSFHNEPNIISITITDALGSPLAQIHSKKTEPDSAEQPAKIIIHEIQLKSFNSDNDFDNLLMGQSRQSNDIIGYVSVALSYESILQRQHDILLNSFYIAATLLIIIGFITRRISNLLGRPILSLASNVKNIARGDYNLPSIEYQSSDEISVLISGIQDMALVIEHHQKISEQKVSIATQELRLQNDKLFEAQDKLIRASRAKSNFISHISHEIRTPLNGIIGFIEAVKRTQLSEKQQQLIQSSHLSAKNLHIIINEVLDLAQLEAGKMKINRTDFQLKSTIEDTLATLSVLAQANRVNIIYKHDLSAPEFINQDPVKLGQILVNLVGNAIKFSPNSTVNVSLQAQRPKDNYIEICIHDQGIGISDTNIKTLFHEFSQVDQTTNTEGTGLGLVITKHLLDIIEGTITVQSKLGEGTRFCFSIPYKNASQTPLLSKENDEEETFPDLSSVRVLVADDNEINRLLLTHLLETQHAQVTCANDGQQAIDLASQQDFDLLLLDLRMPFKMGNEALYEIRRHSSRRNNTTPAIAVTAHITTGEERANHISAFDGYLVKPIDHAQFFSLIEQLLSQHDSKAPAFTPAPSQQKASLSNKMFDYQRAMKNMNADQQLLTIIIAKFFNELDSQRTSVSASIREGDFLTAAEIVHKIQGSCAYCGMNSLQIAAKKLEINLRDGKTTLVQHDHKKFEYEVSRLINSKDKIMLII